jgi:choline-sulfatase
VFAEYDLRTPKAKYMIRDGDWKLTYWTHDIPELYNLRADPEEMTNLALGAQHREVVSALRTKLFDWYRPPE